MNSKKNEKKRIKKIRKKNKRLFKIFLTIGFVSLILQYILFSNTIISYYVVLIVIFISGLIGSYFIYNKYCFAYKVDGVLSYILTFFQSSVFYGGLIGLLFLTINYFLSSGLITKKEYKIIDRHSVQGRKYHRSERVPKFTILINNQEKEFKYSHSYFKNMDAYNSITIETQKGFFGFDIIENRVLNK